MRKILTIVWKDLSVLMRDGTAILLAIAAPLVLTLGLGLVTGGFSDDAPTISRVPVLLVDQDGGQFAAALIDLFTGDDLSDLLAAEQWNDEAAAVERVRRGDAAAVVVIPAGFSDAFLPDATTGRMPAPVALRVYGDAGSPIGAAVVRAVADEFTNRIHTNVATVQVALTGLARRGVVSPAELPAAGRALGERLFAEQDGAADPLIAIREESVATDSAAGFNPLAYFAPAMALLFLMYAVTLGARTLLSERRDGTLARMLVAPVTPGQVLSGKVAGIFLSGFLQLAVLIVLTTILFRLSWGNPLGVLLLVITAALAATGWGLLLASLSTNAGQIGALGMALALIFGILGGSFVPGQEFGPVLEWAGRVTPNRWAMAGFVALASGEGLAGIATPVAALLVMAAILFVVAAAFFRRRQTSLLTG
jgi:ABC-2 type transport system permease protein